jgi:hypothetical protein
LERYHIRLVAIGVQLIHGDDERVHFWMVAIGVQLIHGDDERVHFWTRWLHFMEYPSMVSVLSQVGHTFENFLCFIIYTFTYALVLYFIKKKSNLSIYSGHWLRINPMWHDWNCSILFLIFPT